MFFIPKREQGEPAGRPQKGNAVCSEPNGTDTESLSFRAAWCDGREAVVSLSTFIQVSLELSLRDQHSAEARQFTKNFSSDEPSNGFFANAQLTRAGLDIEGLTLGNWRRIHRLRFHESTAYDPPQLLGCICCTISRVWRQRLQRGKRTASLPTTRESLVIRLGSKRAQHCSGFGRARKTLPSTSETRNRCLQAACVGEFQEQDVQRILRRSVNTASVNHRTARWAWWVDRGSPARGELVQAACAGDGSRVEFSPATREETQTALHRCRRKDFPCRARESDVNDSSSGSVLACY